MDFEKLVQSRQSDRKYRPQPVEKEKLLIPDAGHGEAYTRDPETYFSTVRAFVEKYI